MSFKRSQETTQDGYIIVSFMLLYYIFVALHGHSDGLFIEMCRTDRLRRRVFITVYLCLSDSGESIQ